MKKLYMFLIVPFFVISCSKTPQANFHVEVTKAKVGSELFFYNDSENANSYEWDFGDGSAISKDANPFHIYKTTGKYRVTLSAFSKKGKESQAYKYIEVVEPSLVVIEVVEYENFDYIGNASVVLFSSLEHWNLHNETNAIVEGFTDEDGIVVFGDLAPKFKSVFVDVWEKNHDNWLIGTEDEKFIKINLMPEKVLWFTAWVDYFPTKGNERGEKKAVIKKIEKREPVKTYQSANGNIDYETLLKKSVIVE